MTEVPLFLSDGEPVGIIAIMPQFDPPPDVLQWGDRTFVRQLVSIKPEFQYREVFAVAVVDWRKE